MESAMPWQEVDTVDLRREFVQLSRAGTLNLSELCRRFKISRKTGYKWLRRYEKEGDKGLYDRSCCPHHQPRRSSVELEQAVLEVRQRFPEWGGRKLARVMRNEGQLKIPSPSTITQILRRHGQLHPPGEPVPANYIRFEHPHPNDLWQMDFKGDFPLMRGRCHPLTVLDDHSRFSVCLAACDNERSETVKVQLIQVFEHYGLPKRMTMDNGSPWGGSGSSFTQLTVWLIENGVRVSHSRPYHPQTQGKDERFHRTLNAELIGRRTFAGLREVQNAFGPWRHRYNTQRPHEALNMDTPIEHYQPSSQVYRPALAAYEYAPGDYVRKVSPNLECAFKNYRIFIGQAFRGKYIALRPTINDGVYTMHFCHQWIGQIDLNTMTKRNGKRAKKLYTDA